MLVSVFVRAISLCKKKIHWLKIALITSFTLLRYVTWFKNIDMYCICMYEHECIVFTGSYQLLKKLSVILPSNMILGNILLQKIKQPNYLRCKQLREKIPSTQKTLFFMSAIFSSWDISAFKARFYSMQLEYDKRLLKKELKDY